MTEYARSVTLAPGATSDTSRPSSDALSKEVAASTRVFAKSCTICRPGAAVAAAAAAAAAASGGWENTACTSSVRVELPRFI